jgi:hypothetical protein
VVLPVRRDRVARGLAVAGAIGVFLGCWELLHHWFYAHHQLADTPTYERYGRAMRHGILPYRDIPVEYPPGALPVFVAPTFVDGYVTTFGWLMAACGAACIAFAAAAGARVRARDHRGLAARSGRSPNLRLLARLFVVGSLAALLHDRHRLGWAALGGAIAAKLYGLVLLPLALAWTLRRRGTRELLWSAACGVAVVAVAAVPFAILAPHGLWQSIRGESSPLQIKLGASSSTFGHPTVEATPRSRTSPARAPSPRPRLCSSFAFLALWVAFARERADRSFATRRRICVRRVRQSAHAVLIWLVDRAFVRGRRGIVCTACSLRTPADECLLRSGTGVRLPFHLAWVVLLRNLVLVGLLVAHAAGPRSLAARSAAVVHRRRRPRARPRSPARAGPENLRPSATLPPRRPSMAESCGPVMRRRCRPV